ncbi:MAG: hypothetical protein B655_1548 [Methanobacterium sp. Maddingley MBC34]|nr:MAG: hypothetical protein B655_1548 [Methanobacterium sp. Maddingley MBC34]
MFIIHEEYRVESETKYDEPSETLLMGITVIIPDRLLPNDAKNSGLLFVDQ